MSLVMRVINGFRALFRRHRADDELDAELREYLDAAIAEKMRAGLSKQEAVRAARAEMGSIEAVKDRVRDVGWESIVESVWQDVRYGARMLRRSPGFTTLIVLLLALGIGANTAVFSVINTLMLRDLPVTQPERLVELAWQYPGDPRMNFFGASVYEHFRDHNHVLSDVIGVSPVRFQLTRDGHDAETVEGQYVTGTFFSALGVQPAMGQEKPEERRRVMLNCVAPKYFETLGTPLISGRDFRFEDGGYPRVAIVNAATARHYFGDRSPLGKHVTFEGQAAPYEIVGVVGDAKYEDLHQPAPRTIYLHAFQERCVANELALRTSVNPTAVAGEVRRVVRETFRAVPVTRITTLADQVDKSIVPERLLATLAAFFGALGAILAAIGLYGLLVYTIARRLNEIGVRMALGATERDVIRMVLNDALRLVGAGLLLGAPLAIWSGKFAATFVQTSPVQPTLPIVFGVLAMVGVALLAAYVPARRAARVNPIEALRHS